MDCLVGASGGDISQPGSEGGSINRNTNVPEEFYTVDFTFVLMTIVLIVYLRADCLFILSWYVQDVSLIITQFQLLNIKKTDYYITHSHTLDSPITIGALTIHCHLDIQLMMTTSMVH